MTPEQELAEIRATIAKIELRLAALETKAKQFFEDTNIDPHLLKKLLLYFAPKP